MTAALNPLILSMAIQDVGSEDIHQITKDHIRSKEISERELRAENFRAKELFGEDHRTIGIGHYMSPDNREIFERALPHRADDWEDLSQGKGTLSRNEIELLFDEDTLVRIRDADEKLPFLRLENFPQIVRVQAYGLWFQGSLAQSEVTQSLMRQAAAGEATWEDAALEFLNRKDYILEDKRLPGTDKRYEEFAQLVRLMTPQEDLMYPLPKALEADIRPERRNVDGREYVVWQMPNTPGYTYPPGYSYRADVRDIEERYPTFSSPGGHPFVGDSNVLTSTIEADGKHYVIPTMIGGKKHGDDRAAQVALETGLQFYPRFDGAEDADLYSKWVHDRVDSEGFLVPPPPQSSQTPDAQRRIALGILDA